MEPRFRTVKRLTPTRETDATLSAISKMLPQMQQAQIAFQGFSASQREKVQAPVQVLTGARSGSINDSGNLRLAPSVSLATSGPSSVLPATGHNPWNDVLPNLVQSIAPSVLQAVGQGIWGWWTARSVPAVPSDSSNLSVPVPSDSSNLSVPVPSDSSSDLSGSEPAAFQINPDTTTRNIWILASDLHAVVVSAAPAHEGQAVPNPHGAEISRLALEMLQATRGSRPSGCRDDGVPIDWSEVSRLALGMMMVALEADHLPPEQDPIDWTEICNLADEMLTVAARELMMARQLTGRC